MPTASVSKVEFFTEEHLQLQNAAIGAELYYTIDGSTPSKASTLYREPILITEEGLVKAVAINTKGEASDVLEVPCVKLQFMEGTETPGTKKGLNCKLAVGKFSSCKEVEQAKGKMFPCMNLTIPDNVPQDNFGLVFEGKVTVPRDGLYKFSLGSDDGSMLYINNEVIIDNDGYHGMEHKRAGRALKTGTYTVKLIYFEATGGEDLKLSVQAPGSENITDLSEFLSH